MGDAPLIDPAGARKPSPKVVHLWRIQPLLWAIFIAGSAFAIGGMLDARSQASVGGAVVLVIGVLAAVLWPPARYRSWSFSLEESDVVLRRGVLWRVTSIIPYSRIQHVDTRHGPLERRLGLSAVVIFTAGTVGAAMEIPGLSAAEADELRDMLANLSGSGDSV